MALSRAGRYPSRPRLRCPVAHAQTSERALNPLPALIFCSRWLQLPLYLGLIVAQGVYVVLFLKELWHLISHATSLSEQEIMLPCSA